jgi:hypothetical protein
VCNLGADVWRCDTAKFRPVHTLPFLSSEVSLRLRCSSFTKDFDNWNARLSVQPARDAPNWLPLSMLWHALEQPKKVQIRDVFLDDRRGDVRNAAEGADLGTIHRRSESPRGGDGTSNGLLRLPIGMHQRQH